MAFFIVPAVALGASLLTFFSGFGLGTLLLPAFALFFPIDVSIAMTAVVHFLNNIFKLFLVGKNTDVPVLLRFGLPGIVASFAGAYLLLQLGEIREPWMFILAGFEITTSPENLVIATLMMIFALFEGTKMLDRFEFDRKYLPFGGLLSGFFGGLSGHQGALRSAFMLRCNLPKESFIATGVGIACLIDVTRLGLYSNHLSSEFLQSNMALIGTATLAAFAGAYAGSRLLKKTTMQGIQKTVAVMLFLIAVGIAGGWI